MPQPRPRPVWQPGHWQARCRCSHYNPNLQPSPVFLNMSDAATLTPLRAALDSYVDPYLGESLGAAQAVQDVTANPGGAHARIRLGFPVGGYQGELAAALQNHL